LTSMLYGLFFAKRPSVIYAYHPPLTVGISAAIIRFFRRAPMVYDIQDMWPDTLRATGMLSNERVLRGISRACDWVYKKADQLVVLSPGFKRLLIERGVPESKIEVIYNWCAEYSMPTSEDCNSIPTKLNDRNSFQILFAGNIGKAQALDAVLEAASLLQERAIPIHFTFLGSGLEEACLKDIAMDRSLSNVTFLQSVPMSQVGNYLAAADALLVHLRKDPLFSITIPSKT